MAVSCIYSIRSNSYLEMLFQLQYNGIRIFKKKLTTKIGSAGVKFFSERRGKRCM